MKEGSAKSAADERRFADSHPLRLFPTLVWRVELADDVRARVNASVVQAVGELRVSLPPLERGEGWQSQQDLHQSASFSELVGCIDAAAAEGLAVPEDRSGRALHHRLLGERAGTRGDSPGAQPSQTIF
jgi:hypothetical protein